MKKIMLFIILLSFSCLVYADVCIAGSDSCDVSDEEVCIPAEMMKEIHKSNKILGRAPDLVESKWTVPRTIPFDVALNFCESSIFQIGTTCNAAVHYCAIDHIDLKKLKKTGGYKYEDKHQSLFEVTL